MRKSEADVILQTIGMINAALVDDRNALVSTMDGQISPSTAYIELIRELLKLNCPK